MGMRMLAQRKWLIAVAMTAMIVPLMYSAPADATGGKVDICHANGKMGQYHLISISENSEQKHRDNHGDGKIGDAVPGQDGYTFDENCVPALAPQSFLVRAVSTDEWGVERPIVEMIDSDGNGVPSSGDVVRFYEYPEDFEGILYTAFQVPDLVVVDVASVSQATTHRVTGSSDGNLEWYVTWYVDNDATLDGTDYEYLDFEFENYATGYYTYGQFFDGHVVTYGGDRMDMYVNGDSFDLYRYNPTDDAFVDIQFKIGS